MPAPAMPREHILDHIAMEWIVAVIRAESNEQALKITEALFSGHIKIVEITFTCPDPPSIIKALIDDGPPDLIVGAGTVCTREQAAAALDAGAQFIVSPGLVEEVIAEAKGRGVAVMPGAVTATEIMNAARLGADVIKLFPGSLFGPAYAKALRGPFPQLRFMPTGGVSLENIKEWKAAGVFAVGVGTELVQKEAVKAGKFEVIASRARSFVEAVKRASGGTMYQRR